MMKKIVLSAALLCWLPISAMAAIDAVFYYNDEHFGETVNLRLSTPHTPKIFTIAGEKPRIVLDFMGVDYLGGKNTVEADGELVRGVRIGSHPEPSPKTRVVIDLASGIEFSYSKEMLDNLLTISIFKAADGKPAGTVPDGAGQNGPESSQDEMLFSLEKRPGNDPFYPKSSDLPVNSDKTETDEVWPKQAEENLTDNSQAEQLPAGIAELLEISFDDKSDKGEMVVFKLNGFHPPKIFGVEKDTPRVICDFPDTALADGVNRLIESNGANISKIRTSKLDNPDRVRVVMELVPNKTHNLQQLFFKEENIFIIIVNN
ncbi:MAG: hypothetical protein CSB24_00955 [Deltaproteobacteria bacterium]|nr:MAG: hypothetical protein CSB24_00955 [Deltaproteobacteria bacterium]